MFHQITDNKDSWDDVNCSITFTKFKQLIDSLKRDGKVFLPIYKVLQNTENNSSKFISLTFDDAYQEVYEYIYPFLKSNNIPFTVFITLDYIDKPGYLSKEQVELLTKENLCTIGAHTLTHPILRGLNDVESLHEIEESKNRLETTFNIKVEYFAYPYGSIFAVSKRDIKIAEKAGFKAAFSTISTSINKKTINSTYFLPRINVNDRTKLKV